MNQHDNPDRPLDNSPQQPNEAAPYPPPPPIFSQEPAPEFDPNAAPPPPSAGSAYGNTGNYGNTTGGSLTAPTKDERNWAMFAHLSALLVGLIASAVGATFLGFLGPLAIYLMKKDESPFVADQAKEALNFYISVGIILLVLFVLTFTVILAILTIPLMILVSIAAFILSIIAAVKSSNGELYRYPFTLRLIN